MAAWRKPFITMSNQTKKNNREEIHVKNNEKQSRKNKQEQSVADLEELIRSRVSTRYNVITGKNECRWFEIPGEDLPAHGSTPPPSSKRSMVASRNRCRKTSLWKTQISRSNTNSFSYV
jgi:hypothetical protein